MRRVAIVGANGQVGTEVCLRLWGRRELEIVPIVRNPSGSAFLRMNGVRVRHGRMANGDEAGSLIGDCDCVASFVLSMTGRPRTDHVLNRLVLKSICEASRPGADVIFFSSMMVYAPNMHLRIPDAYGLEKLLCERLVRRWCRRTGRRVFILRPGHVLGPLQTISQRICEEVRRGPVFLPAGGSRPSNTVFSASVAEAVHRISDGREQPGTYDLISYPQWSWLDVFAHHAKELGETLAIMADRQSGAAHNGLPSFRMFVRRLLWKLSSSHTVRARLAFLMAYLPESANQRVHAEYLKARAHREIASMWSREDRWEVPDWREVGSRRLGSLSLPLRALEAYPLPKASWGMGN